MTTDVGPSLIRRPSASNGWWSAYRGRISPGYLQLIAAEAKAPRIVHFHPIFIPGLLQTRSYARAITPATTLGGMPAAEVDLYVEVRMRRQMQVFAALPPVRLVLLLDETSLRRPVGRRTTMREQLNHLLTMIDHPNVNLVVVPRQNQPHPGLLGAFMLFQYDDPRLNDVICFDGPMGNLVIRNRPDLVTAYGLLADRLAGGGLRQGHATRAIHHALDELG